MDFRYALVTKIIKCDGMRRRKKICALFSKKVFVAMSRSIAVKMSFLVHSTVLYVHVYNLVFARRSFSIVFECLFLTKSDDVFWREEGEKQQPTNKTAFIQKGNSNTKAATNNKQQRGEE